MLFSAAVNVVKGASHKFAGFLNTYRISNRSNPPTFPCIRNPCRTFLETDYTCHVLTAGTLLARTRRRRLTVVYVDDLHVCVCLGVECS